MIDRVEFYIYRARNGYQVVADIEDASEMERWNEPDLDAALNRMGEMVREAFARRAEKRAKK